MKTSSTDARKFCPHRLISVATLMLIIQLSIVAKAQNVPIRINATAIRSDGRIAIVYSDGSVEIRDIQNVFFRRFYNLASPTTTIVIWDPIIAENQIALEVNNETNNDLTSIEIIDADKGTILRSMPTSIFLEPYNLLSWSADGNKIAAALSTGAGSSDHRYVTVWDARTGKEQGTFLYSSTPITDISWRPQHKNQLAVAVQVESGKVLILDTLTGDITSEIAVGGEGYIVKSIDWSPEGDQLAATAYFCDCIIGNMSQPPSFPQIPHLATIADVDTSATKKTWGIPSDDSLIRWRPDGKQVGINVSGQLFLFDSATGTRIPSPDALSSDIYDFDWSSDSKKLLLAVKTQTPSESPSIITAIPNAVGFMLVEIVAP